MDRIRVHLYNLWQALQFILYWLLVSIVTGSVCGLVGTLLYQGIHHCDSIFASDSRMVILLPFAGLLIVFLYQKLGVKNAGTDTLIEAVQSEKDVPIAMFPAVSIGTILTHLFGGSAGKEGVALQAGGSIAFFLGKKVFHMRPEDLKVMCMTGMSALFAAVFGMPIAATIFVSFFVTAGTFVDASLVPGFIASILAYRISMYFGMVPLHFDVSIPAFSEVLFLKVIVFAIVCGVISTVYCDALHLSHHLFGKYFGNPYIRIMVAGAIIAVFVFLIGQNYSGTGMDLIMAAVEQGQARPYDFLLKIILTAITLGAGYRGGEIMPSFFIGATFGCVAAPFFGIPAAFGAAIGMICIFVGATNQTIAPIIMALEMFDGQGLLLFAVAVIVCYIAGGYTGIYGSQIIMYSKISMQRIDVNVNDEHREKWKTKFRGKSR